MRHRLGSHPWRSMPTTFRFYDTPGVIDQWCTECGAVREKWPGGVYITIREPWNSTPEISSPAENVLLLAAQMGVQM